MSLRAKILWFFTVFAVIPILTVGVLDYVMYRHAYRTHFQQRMEHAVGSDVADDFVVAKDTERLRRLLFLVAVVLLTSMAFSLLLNRVMRSLGELTAAAEKIGRGDFAPWLPLPAKTKSAGSRWRSGPWASRSGICCARSSRGANWRSSASSPPTWRTRSATR